MKFPELLWSFASLPVDYVCLDTETTGLPDENGMPDIVSLGLTAVHHAVISTSLEFKIRPTNRISQEARRVHGIGDEEATTFEDLPSQWRSISDQIYNKLIVIHNASFDWPILIDQLNRTGLRLPKVKGVFCSQKSAYPWALANSLECTKRGPSLDVLTSVLTVENLRSLQGGLHGAAIDSRQTALVVERLKEVFLE
ncbi:MAG: DNA polymerase-3 subunit epsilon [Gammaproteobacteria bacterium]|jgi:DNA polymerase-3 subunit epsilon